jgi:hypothetical protein
MRSPQVATSRKWGSPAGSEVATQNRRIEIYRIRPGHHSALGVDSDLGEVRGSSNEAKAVPGFDPIRNSSSRTGPSSKLSRSTCARGTITSSTWDPVVGLNGCRSMVPGALFALASSRPPLVVLLQPVPGSHQTERAGGEPSVQHEGSGDHDPSLAGRLHVVPAQLQDNALDLGPTYKPNSAIKALEQVRSHPGPCHRHDPPAPPQTH